MEASRHLAGKVIVVTRPAHQAHHLADLIREAGGEPLVFPALAIDDVADTAALIRIIEKLAEFDLAIFISPNAVMKAMNLIRRHGALPASLRIAAIGKGSRRELARLGVTDVVAPEGRFDSEGLLALDEFANVSRRRILIFRGEGGREHLADELGRRGAEITYAECYRRVKPEADAGDLLRRWARGAVHGITATSGEVVSNFLDLVGKLGREWMKATPLFVPHPRIAEAARGLGLSKVIVTAAGDEGLVAGLAEYFAKS
jgi:uroporphyrinogen-III synthase